MPNSTDPFLRSHIIGGQAGKNGFNTTELHTDHIPKYREARAEVNFSQLNLEVNNCQIAEYLR